MKIINRKEFLSMPSGTLFSYFQPNVFDGLKIKHHTLYCDSIPCDFVYQSLIGNVKCNGSDDMDDILYNALENGTRFELGFDSAGREALYDEDQLFAVYEKNDLADLIITLQKLV